MPSSHLCSCLSKIGSDTTISFRVVVPALFNIISYSMVSLADAPSTPSELMSVVVAEIETSLLETNNWLALTVSAKTPPDAGYPVTLHT